MMKRFQFVVVDDVIGECFLMWGGHEIDEMVLIDLMKQCIKTLVIGRKNEKMIKFSKLIAIEMEEHDGVGGEREERRRGRRKSWRRGGRRGWRWVECSEERIWVKMKGSDWWKRLKSWEDMLEIWEAVWVKREMGKEKVLRERRDLADGAIGSLEVDELWERLLFKLWEGDSGKIPTTPVNEMRCWL
jgi:hypothetical protein